MSLENVVQVILERGAAEASQILDAARAERERTLAEVRDDAARALAETEASARAEAERKRVQSLARAELESRKIVLAAQKEALDKVYAGALARLGKLPENADVLRRLLEANKDEWRSGGKVYSNPHDESVVRKIVGSTFAGTIECAGGVVIESGDGTRRVDLRYDSILRDAWDDAVKEVAQTLWPSKA
jgi:V/A-type H+/Na+-transporting ATPase subunit E